MNKHCDNCFCLPSEDLLQKAYNRGDKVRLFGDKFVGQIINLVIGLKNIRYSIIYPDHQYCIVAVHDSIEKLN